MFKGRPFKVVSANRPERIATSHDEEDKSKGFESGVFSR